MEFSYQKGCVSYHNMVVLIMKVRRISWVQSRRNVSLMRMHQRAAPLPDAPIVPMLLLSRRLGADKAS